MKIELLSPAKNLECGIAAVLHGADAVYVGAPKFSARAAASNSLEDIKKLVDFAHLYYVRVYVALNTILNDEELTYTQQLIYKIYETGADALIIQDMGILELQLPDIELHASTQCDNRTAEKVKFLEKCGFAQAVLARELSIEQIAAIRRKTSIRLESFVHGALCVSYSGQCFMSQAFNGRSANRGECAQMCRLPYSLVDANEKIIAKNQHLLSLKDLDASNFIEKLIAAGVTSFKIEGRLKNIDYVKNVTAFYRQKIDAIIDEKFCKRASSGKTKFFFTPDVEKTFFRGATSYFLEKRQKDITEFRTPKSLGKQTGIFKLQNHNSLIVETQLNINNGDGLCAFDINGKLTGFRVNRVDGSKIFPQIMPKIEKNAIIFRNFDINFLKQLENKSADRKIFVKIMLEEYMKEEKQFENGIKFSIIDEDNRSAEEFLPVDFVVAQNPAKQRQSILDTLKKFGDTIFEVADIQIFFEEMWFIPASKVAQVRRILVKKLLEVRLQTFEKRLTKHQKTSHTFPAQEVDYHANIHNRKAAEFYLRHQVKNHSCSFEDSAVRDAELMRTKHCLKFSFGFCPKQNPKKQPAEPLLLVRGNQKLLLGFDCKNCEMTILQSV